MTETEPDKTEVHLENALEHLEMAREEESRHLHVDESIENALIEARAAKALQKALRKES